MSNIKDILRESIQSKCGRGGLMRFNAIYAGGFEKEDGTLDLAGVGEALRNTFPADQADAIANAVRAKLEAGGQQMPGRPADAAEGPADGGEDTPAIFAKYFNFDPNHVRDIIDEARRLRTAMGIATLSERASPAGTAAVPEAPQAPAPAGNAMLEQNLAAQAAEVKPAANLTAEAPPAEGASHARPAEAQPGPGRVIADQQSAIDEKVVGFAYSRTAYTSIDIIDFIRYLKDKGYSFQENIVLEKIYVTIEERKKKARSAIEKEIDGLIDATQAPGEPDIRGFVRQLREAGFVFEEEDIRCMIRAALMRRSSNG